MFNKQQANTPPLPPAPQGDTDAMLIDYTVVGIRPDEKIRAHNVQLDGESLVLLRIVNANEQQQRIVPVAIYAPGQWAKCSTTYTGIQKSALSIR